MNLHAVGRVKGQAYKWAGGMRGGSVAAGEDIEDETDFLDSSGLPVGDGCRGSGPIPIWTHN